MPSKKKAYSINRSFAAMVGEGEEQKKVYFTVRDSERLSELKPAKLKELVESGAVTEHGSEEEVPVTVPPPA